MSIRLLLLLVLFLFSCQTKKQHEQYPTSIGDIAYDSSVDKSDFTLCNEDYIYQYFNDSKGVQYEGEKQTLDSIFFTKYKNQNLKGETGLIRIRFVVNCKGETDRFRLLEMNSDYQAYIMDKRISNQLLALTKSLNGWKSKSIEDHPIDYYQYLIFKIEDGNLTEIMP